MSVVTDSGNEDQVEVGYDFNNEDDYNVDELSKFAFAPIKYLKMQ